MMASINETKQRKLLIHHLLYLKQTIKDIVIPLFA